jgi:hypothetical protein
MQYKYFFIFVAVVLFLFSSCSDDNPVKPQDLDTSSFTYPVKDGGYWIYYGKTFYTNFNPDSVKNYVSIHYDTNKVTILYDTVINSVTTKCILNEYSISDGKKNTRFYYVITDTALIWFANRGFNNGMLPVKDGPGDDSLRLCEPPQPVLVYPVTKGKVWYTGTGNGIMRKYVGFENVSTPAGVISCMKTERFYNFPNISYFDYYSGKGIIKSTFIFPNVLITTPQYPEGVGNADMNYESLLNSYRIIP